MNTTFNTPAEGIGTKVILSVRRFKPDARFAYPGANFQPEVIDEAEYTVTLDSASCFAQSVLPSDRLRYYIAQFQFPGLLMRQHGLYGPMGITLKGIA